jgi:hypothetical protein
MDDRQQVMAKAHIAFDDTLTSSTIGGWGHIQNKIHIHFRI